MGWHKRVLRVNLTDGSCNAEPLNMQWAAEYLGQRGLATKYLLEEIDPKVDPLSPDNKLIFATGPLTGTMASTGGRFSVITKGALTGAIACSNSGGYFGAELKFAGWDMIIFEGRAASPVYLLIKDDSVELLPADDLWGKSVWETDEILHRRHQDPQLRISAIGQSGEAGRAVCLCRQRSAPGSGAFRRRHRDGVEEPEGDRGAGHPGGQGQGSRPIHARGDGEKTDTGGECGNRPGTAHLRHPGVDERNQRSGRIADQQRRRRSV